ncbi:IS3 family transposase [Pseudomonas sp. EA_65y_Pfl1_P113]|uniref:IS3 family transposase n=2 Tax=unclassified Pseudomonas TaxID=196821 RepID=UPI0030D9DEC5
MKKYTEQAKLSVVEDYCSGSAGHREVAHRHGVNASSLRKWIAAYQALGTAGLKSKRKKNYSPEFKLNVLQRMREEELSYRQVAALFDIRKSDIIGEWERRYDEGGLEALSRQPGSGLHKKMTNPIPSIQLESSDDEARTRDDLLAELNQLRMEIAYFKKARCLGSSEGTSSAAEKAQIVIELRQEHSLEGLLKLAGLARSTFYYQQKVQQSVDKYAELKSRIRSIFDEHKGRYGYRRITAAVRRAGHLVNHKTVQRLMGELQLKSRVRIKKYRAYRGEEGQVAPNLLKRKFDAKRPNQKWVTDVTEFRVGGQKLYLSPILDLYNGEIIAFKTARRPLFDMVGAMLRQAFERLRPRDKPILHSDQGWQYRMPIYRRVLNERAVKPSMSRKGNCYDNAAMESFFGTLKSEFFYLNKFNSLDELEAGIEDYIHYYNHSRIRLKLSGLSPVEYRTQARRA